MKKTLSVLCASLLLVPATALAGDVVEGYWLTENERSVIHIEECDQGICGKVHWIIKGGLQTDEKNPEEALRSRSMCGLQILWGFNNEGPGQWEDGHIYKADDGDTYAAEVHLERDNVLNVRGYVGFSFIGKSQNWTRVSADDYPACVGTPVPAKPVVRKKAVKKKSTATTRFND